MSHPKCATAFTCDEESEVGWGKASEEGSYLLPSRTWWCIKPGYQNQSCFPAALPWLCAASCPGLWSLPCVPHFRVPWVPVSMSWSRENGKWKANKVNGKSVTKTVAKSSHATLCFQIN